MDRDKALELIKHGIYNLLYFSDEFIGDKEIVLAAVKIDGLDLVNASDSLKNDKDVVLAAIFNNSEAYQYCGELMMRNREVIALANKGLSEIGESVDDYTFLNENLEQLKQKYGVDKLEMALEMEAAELEVGELSDGINSNKPLSYRL